MTSSDFVRAMPSCGLQIGTNEMVIFGGDTTKAFVHDTREVQNSTKIATVATTRGSLSSRSRFCNKSDFVARQYKNFVYAIDSSEKFLHVYQVKEQAWQS